MAFCEEELVSVDFTSSPYSSIIDAPLTNVIAGNLVKVFSWYDNESGYACRMRDLAIYMAKKIVGSSEMRRPFIAGNWKMHKTDPGSLLISRVN